jgi:hypothetical protein
MIRETGGYYWLQTSDADGLSRFSYCGYLGRPETVKAWTSAKGIAFVNMGSGSSASTTVGGGAGSLRAVSPQRGRASSGLPGVAAERH